MNGSANHEPQSGKMETKHKKRASIAGLDGSPKDGPVKAACLSCRSKKAKCDGGKPVCAACEKRGLVCEYVKSRRGGPRIRRPPPPSALRQFLGKLDEFWVDRGEGIPYGEKSPNEDTTNIVRSFSSRDEILRCYYTELHPFLPVLPLRKWLPDVLASLPTPSPFLLAAQTLLTLAPHSQDTSSSSADSKRLRSAAAHALALETEAAITRLTGSGQGNLECVQALTMLSMYTWGSSLNLNLTNSYAERAINLALQLGLNNLDQFSRSPSGSAVEDGDWRKDMIRRTWWVTYNHQLLSTLSSGLPAFMPHSAQDRLNIDFPACGIDDRSWSQWIGGHRRCSGVLETVVSVYIQRRAFQAATEGQTSMGTAEAVQKELETRKQMADIDTEILKLLKQTENDAVVELVPGGEEEVVRNMQLAVKLAVASLHIHIHRQQAFPEVSLFSKLMCGLPGMPDSPTLSDPSSIASSMAEYSMVQPTLLLDSTITIPTNVNGNGTLNPLELPGEELSETMWQPALYHETLPDPWFTQPGAAGNLYAPVEITPHWSAPLPPSIPIPTFSQTTSERSSSKEASPVASITSSTSSKAHKPWGLDENDKPEVVPEYDLKAMAVFPPGVSLERCATAAHAIIRLEVLHRSAQIAMWEGPPRWLPFCSCGLVVGAYAFLLLALAVQAEHSYQPPNKAAVEQIEGLLTNVKIIVAGLEAYGIMWDGIAVMAREVRAALEAATRLPDEMRAQIRQYKRDMSNCSSSYNGHSVPSAGTSDSEEVQNGLGFQLGYPDQNAGTYPSQFQGLSLY